MKNSIIIKQIRASYIHKLIYPVILILIVGIIGFYSPISSYIKPAVLSSQQDLEEVQYDKKEFIQTTVDTLYYSGSDYLVNGKMEGFIYYSLIDNSCRFYIIDAGETTVPEKILNNMTIKGKLIREEQIFNNLIASVSKELNWTEEGLRATTNPYMVTTIGLLPWNQVVLYGCLVLVLLFAVIDFMRSIIVICFPSTSSTLSYLGKSGSVYKQVLEAEKEMSDECTIINDGIYLTPNYLIFLKYNNISVIRGDSIAWAYYHNRLSRFLNLSLNMTYMLHIVVKSGRVFEWFGRNTDDLEFIIKCLQERYPEIICGYSEKNKRLAHKGRK